MQITLNQIEIEDAIRDFVLGRISVADDTQIEIDLRAGRGDNGFTATLDLSRVAYDVQDCSSTVEAETHLPEHNPAADVPIPAKKSQKTQKTTKSEKAEQVEKVEEASEEDASTVAETISSSADSIPDAPVDEEEIEEKPTESPRKPSIFQFNAAKQPAE